VTDRGFPHEMHRDRRDSHDRSDVESMQVGDRWISNPQAWLAIALLRLSPSLAVSEVAGKAVASML